MKMQKVKLRRQAQFRRGALALASAALFGATGAAHAFEVKSDNPDWAVRFDNTVQYNLGVRTQGVDPRIGNTTAHRESDNRFPNAGDVVTNRLALLSEFDAVYQGRMGLRLSGSVFKDFAYDDKTRTAPALSNYIKGEYSGYTKRNQIEGSQLLDAYVFTNFDVNERPSTLRVGRLTQFWGNALFFGAAGVNYSQSASDVSKQLTSPGATAKELALPRGQINFRTQLSDQLQLGAQYFLQWEANRMPSGGTYLGAPDFGWEGPDRGVALNPGPPTNPLSRRLDSAMPDDINNNFGLQLRWSPTWLDGTLGFYYRQFDEVAAAGPLAITGANAVYRMVYPDQVKMLGVSLDKQIGSASVGFELSYRQNTGLNTNGGLASLAKDPGLNQVARGDTLNLIANAMSILTPTSFYDTGLLLAEVAVVHKLKVTEREDLYRGINTPGCNSAPNVMFDNRYVGCATDTAVMVGGLFEPQWLQALPGWDLSAPMSAMYGLSGNTASNGIPVYQGDLIYSIGIKGVLQSRYNFTLAYNGFSGHAPEMSTRAPGTYQTANGFTNRAFQYGDRDWLSFTFSTTF